jgi:hypothetical protein
MTHGWACGTCQQRTEELSLEDAQRAALAHQRSNPEHVICIYPIPAPVQALGTPEDGARAHIGWMAGNDSAPGSEGTSYVVWREYSPTRLAI